MVKILLKKYISCDTFEANNPFDDNSFQISDKDMFRYAALVGNFSGHTITQEGRKFYSSMIEMALKEENGYYTIGSDYRNAEQSIKHSISFFMGMFAAEIVAEKVYNISHLYHLTDKIITVTPSGRHPDFFGIDNTGKGILIEAKGTTEKKPRNPAIEYAKGQLEAIQTVITIQANGQPQSFQRDEMNRYVVASSFDKNDRLTYHCVDPKPSQEVERKIEIEIDKAVALYYQHIMNFILCNPHHEHKAFTETFIVSDMGRYKIGLDSEIYNKLREYKDFYISRDENALDKHPLEGLHQCVSEREQVFRRKKLKLTEDVSVGLNGVICI